jgi:hypothetical protein
MPNDLLEFKFAPLSARYPAGAGKRMFFATDEGIGYWDNGFEWKPFCFFPKQTIPTPFDVDTVLTLDGEVLVNGGNVLCNSH